MIKKWRLLLSLFAVFALFAAACGDSDSDSDAEAGDSDDSEETTSGDDEGIRVALVLPGEINDLSWNQQMHSGAETLMAEGLISELKYTELVPEGDAERAIRGFAEDGFDLIVAHSFGYGETAKAVGADFPDTAFAWGGGIGGQEGNVADYAQPFHEAYYLLGILAGGASETGVLGGAGGFDIPACHSLVEAFYLGAQEINADARGVTTYTGDWVDVAVAKEAASAAAADGADVFGACGEGPVLGQIELAREQGLLATGYVGDMSVLAPETVLASMVWDTAELLRPMIDDVNAGSFTPAKEYRVGVADGGLVIAINPDLADRVGAEATALFETRLAEIIAGDFEVPFIPE
ncbi:MAG: BMP family protein [Actinomycetota bacterium]|nr:BMP family protein [Actinomycetota bacterium]